MTIRLFPGPRPIRGDAPRLEAGEASRLRTAALHARRSIGELLHRELLAYVEFGYRFSTDVLMTQLATDVLSIGESTANTDGGRTGTRPPATEWLERFVAEGRPVSAGISGSPDPGSGAWTDVSSADTQTEPPSVAGDRTPSGTGPRRSRPAR